MDNETVSKNFIEQIIDKDIEEGHCQKVVTRFPPEPNGYLHIGHAKSILLNYGLAKEYNGQFNMRFDDTNPTKEKVEFVDSIKKDVEWLGAKWNGDVLFASNYFPQMYEAAIRLIKNGKAYVDDLSAEEIRQYRGTLTEPGKESPYRERSVEENLKLFEEMKEGKYADGEKVLRAKIDMASPNINMRDPIIYRVAHMTHHRTGDEWCIYPMYDFAHPIEDAVEGITHSICTLEFEDHRPLYDWVIIETGYKTSPEENPKQIEFAKLYLTNVVTGKRYIKKLVEDGVVDGWDDPRMPTLVGMRRRGYSAEAIKDFLERVGVSKADSTVDEKLLEHCVREDLNGTAYRAMAVIDPLKVTITNWPEGETMDVEMENHPDHPEWGTRVVKFGRELYIEREDFMEEPPKKYFRLKPEGEVRLKGAYIIKCERVVHTVDGGIDHIECSVDLSSRSGSEGANRKVKGTIHWVNARDCAPFEARLYDQLMTEEWDTAEAADKKDVTKFLSDTSLQVMNGYCEHALVSAKPGDTFQFLRNGYFCKDPDSTQALSVFNRTVPLKDSWAKTQK